jgi:thiol-disulfide isomerase/thioredoxin
MTRESFREKLRRRWKRWTLEALLIVAVVVGVQLWQARGLPEGIAPPLEGMLTDGRVVQVGPSTSSGQALGGTAQLVVFWATWCPVCKAEEGNIESVATDWPVISVAMQSGNAAEVVKHLQQRGLTVPALIDEDGRHAANWKVRGVPTHFIIDPAGNVRFRVVGYATTWGLRARLWWAQNQAL